MGHRALRECISPRRAPLLLISAFFAFSLFSWRLDFISHAREVPQTYLNTNADLSSGDAHTTTTTTTGRAHHFTAITAELNTAIPLPTRTSASSSSSTTSLRISTPSEKPPLPINPGPPTWWRWFNSTAVHTSESDPPADDPVFKGIMPRFWSGKKSNSSEWDEALDGVKTVEKPAGVDKIVGLVFFGRRAQVSILECYLRRNLVKNGGLLDEVIFLTRTNNVDDLKWLDGVVESEPAYTKWAWDGKEWYSSAYEMIKNSTLYIKIDDDIVFVDDAAIPTIVDTKIRHPEYYLIGANVVNQPMLSWIHWRLGAVHPFLPELRPFINDRPDGRTEWRTSGLPGWTGADEFEIPIDWMPPLSQSMLPSNNTIAALRKLPLPSTTRLDDEQAVLARLSSIVATQTPVPVPPLPDPLPPGSPPTVPANDPLMHYRWLPLKGLTRHTLDNTPVRMTQYDAFGNGWKKWIIGAQEHYSFFTNLQAGELSLYKFGIWDFNYDRMGIQFIAMMGSDINAAKPIEKDDERHFSETMTRRTGRHGVVDGRALVAHYSFNQQRRGLQTTDALERYRSFAKEHICEGPMHWPAS